MCGITGGWFHRPLADAALEASLEALRHRGPDESGLHRDGPVRLGMRRLAIIDLEHGQQPLANEDESVWVVFNGEIYDYREHARDLAARGHELRTASDTEVLVHLYEELGTRMPERLRGMFAFALWDARRRRLMLVRDRFGKKPLYWTRSACGGLLFASELKALRPLMDATGTKLELRAQALYDYLSLGYVPQPETIYEGVHALAPGSWLCFDGERTEERRYWSLDYGAERALAYGEALEQTRALVEDAVRLRLRSDVPIGVFLSGGVDSSVVAWEAARQLGPQLRTFTVRTDDPALDESALAARTARGLGVENRVLPLTLAPRDEILALVRHYDQPFADSSALASLAVARLAREHVTVVLNGDGGDEVFAGYRRHLAAHLSGGLAWLPPALAAGVARGLGRVPQRRSALGFSRRFLRALHLPAGARYLAWTSDMLMESEKCRVWKGDRMRPTEDWIEAQIPAGLSGLDAQLCGDQRISLPSDMLVKMDIASMAASVEARSPLLDHRLAEFVTSLPAALRLRGWRRKALLRDAYRERLPREVIDGRKRGFEVPMGRWLEGELRELLNDVLLTRAARVRDYLDGRFVDDLLARRVLAERNWEYLVYGLLVLELWLRDAAEPV